MGRLDRLTDGKYPPGAGAALVGDRAEESPAGWSVCGATLTGAGHLHRAIGNQDAFRCIARDDRAVVVVADGHGSPSYVRSGAGATLAADLLADDLAAIEPETEAGAVRAQLVEVAAAFVERWRTAVLDAVGRVAFTEDEVRLLGDGHPVEPSAAEERVRRAYGTTVLGILVAAGWVRAIAIGDGDLGCVDAAGRHRPLCPLPPTIGVATDSLASADPLAVLRVDAYRADDLIGAWACTDGFSAAQADASWRSLMARQLHEMWADRGPDGIADGLADWLEPAAQVGDDTTMVLALARVPPSRMGEQDSAPPSHGGRRARFWRRL